VNGLKIAYKRVKGSEPKTNPTEKPKSQHKRKIQATATSPSQAERESTTTKGAQPRTMPTGSPTSPEHHTHGTSGHTTSQAPHGDNISPTQARHYLPIFTNRQAVRLFVLFANFRTFYELQFAPLFAPSESRFIGHFARFCLFLNTPYNI
jgi:hypothetical protein